ncbi:aminoacyl-tRNA hydrolase [Spiroplasma chrysopicola]|uniref:Peptidyl-tRNA hydrolase n=1 Tax=Spiroplasma chrysopicola DF-1 TaxID=1276227 RepID=R4U0H9_9MOLU|nr:aminoacyl-tRNA hydrolase [Spiroplasma chrysopicola]AGM24752.1 peptidyl-tRNA hydrolase [Spiroplasma chrysopicola DF-1]
MKLIVGLGNPGGEYQLTRHNVGFLAVDKLVAKYQAQGPKQGFDGIYWETKINGEKVFFLQPQTYMNLSGKSVGAMQHFFKISASDLLIIYDDKDIEFGKIKLRPTGSSAGHNGIKDLINKLGTEHFCRIKIGIGNNKLIAMHNWVLGKFSPQELVTLETEVLVKTTELVGKYLEQNISFEKLMSEYNGK